MARNTEALEERATELWLALEGSLTYRAVMVLVSLEMGTYNDSGVGSFMVEAMQAEEERRLTPEKELMAIGLIEEIKEIVGQESETVLAPTALGSVVAKMFIDEMENILTQDVDVV